MGSKGKMMQLTWPRTAAAAEVAARSDRRAEALLPRVAHAQDEHEMNWIEAIQGKARISCPSSMPRR